jgi:SAM-dependent methyltransferase
MKYDKVTKLIISPAKHLDFGAGYQRRNPFLAKEVFSVDLLEIPNLSNHHRITRMEPLPFPNAFFDSASSYDVLEHLSRDFNGKNEFIFYMNEVSRVLKKGGLAVFVFPGYPSKDAFSDPTHTNFITNETVNFFLGSNEMGGYSGITTNYQLLSNRRLRYWRNWVNLSTEIPDEAKAGIRRRISLTRRSIRRFLFPQHRIWVLQKI